ncbi:MULTISPECIES: hypothetical protein [unclassified Paenibacillus]|uniref:hypothetical protein n=1 Tax=unclassified Paenibacillus TaxID=185978 RepID=UPI001AE83FA5|nr:MULTISPECIES: hypothetical protein [unclassified Paenibacillus]MBP1155543.1 hypothetical protein [Paenibacillus sp. PvP091]MBP1169071.1 hypothetical protein [Paenibacillus sp. PvR098]MBP2440099.1 hypothetical protein [Paenibacillus sp. PvP052]
MWVITGILAAGIVIAVFEVPPLLKRKLKKELFVFLFLLVFGMGLSIAQVMHVNIPNPLDWIKVVYKPLSDVIYGMLQ